MCSHVWPCVATCVFPRLRYTSFLPRSRSFGNTWNLRNGASSLMNYIDVRGIKRGLVTRFPFSDAKGGDAKAVQADLVEG